MAIDALPAPSLPRYSIYLFYWYKSINTDGVDRSSRDKEGDAGAWGAAVEVQESTGGAHADSDVMVMVCGTDGFVETWAGPARVRACVCACVNSFSLPQLLSSSLGREIFSS